MARATVLPDHAEMAQRLAANAVTAELAAMHPEILAVLAGSERTGAGVVLALRMAVHAYLGDGAPLAVVATVRLTLPDLVRVLVDNDGVRADALALLRTTG